MTQTTNRAAELLRQTEEKLKNLLSEAAASADYASIVQIASWAKSLRDLTQSAPGLRAAAGLVQRSNRLAPKSPTRKRSSSNYLDSYPRFYRHGNLVIRVAWSKREKKEYRHKAPYETLKAVATAMFDHGAEGRVFSTEQILPIYDSADGSKVPDYHVYVVISLLKQSGLIDPHGRQGYSIPRPAQFKDAVEGVWDKLATE